jgi:hypothetical protein
MQCVIISSLIDSSKKQIGSKSNQFVKVDKDFGEKNIKNKLSNTSNDSNEGKEKHHKQVLITFKLLNYTINGFFVSTSWQYMISYSKATRNC